MLLQSCCRGEVCGVPGLAGREGEAARVLHLQPQPPQQPGADGISCGHQRILRRLPAEQQQQDQQQTGQQVHTEGFHLDAASRVQGLRLSKVRNKYSECAHLLNVLVDVIVKAGHVLARILQARDGIVAQPLRPARRHALSHSEGELRAVVGEG